MEKVYVGRQPILTKSETIYGYELLFRRGKSQAANVTDGAHATATVIVHTLNDLGLYNLIGRKKGFLNVNFDILSSGYLELLPSELIIFELLEDVEVNHALIGICNALKSKKYKIALDDFTYSRYESLKSIIRFADFVKIDIMSQDRSDVLKAVELLKDNHLTLIAEKVETKEDFSFCLNLGFDLFQGYFFEKPTIVEGSTVSPSQMILLEIFNELSREGEIETVERLFKKSPELDIKLLNFINSAAFYPVQKITSIRQGIIILGYRNLQKWIALMLFAKTGIDIKSNPILSHVAIKGFFMEFLARKITKDRNISDQAFIAGILSHADAILNMSMEEIAVKLNLTEEIKDALLKREGLLGDLLMIADMMKKEEFIEMEPILSRYKLTREDLFECETKAISSFEGIDI